MSTSPGLLSSTSHKALEILRRPFSIEELALIENLLSSIEAEISQTKFSGRQESIEALNLLRLTPSQTLRLDLDEQSHCGSALQIQSWMSANQKLAEWVNSDRPLTWPAIQELHGILTQASSPSLRSGPAVGGNCTYPPPEDLETLVRLFTAEVLEKLGQRHAILEAAELYQWLSTIHPFTDANGRLARLVADWRLAQGGYPPVAYSTSFASYVCVLDDSCRYNRFSAVKVVSQGIRNVCRVLAE